ncbi:MAG TPA: hypothetical protein VK929_09930 [Longimicrobiales bacterium]|nr:hypothetical protein [Longimicrobiales bacterium]
MRRIVALVVILALGVGVYLYRDRLLIAWHDYRGTSPAVEEPSPELADRAERKLNALRDGSSTYAALSAVELESLLAFRYNGVLPGFLDTPVVEMRGDQLRLRARVPVDRLPDIQGLGPAAAFLPDTTEVTVSGRLLPLQPGRVAFAIDDISAQRFPLPRRLVPGALERLGRRDEPGLPADAMALPLPPGANSAYIRRDSLVLLAN